MQKYHDEMQKQDTENILKKIDWKIDLKIDLKNLIYY